MLLLTDDCVFFNVLLVAFKVVFTCFKFDGNNANEDDTLTNSLANGDNALVSSFILDVKVDISEVLKFLLI